MDVSHTPDGGDLGYYPGGRQVTIILLWVGTSTVFISSIYREANKDDPELKNTASAISDDEEMGGFSSSGEESSQTSEDEQ